MSSEAGRFVETPFSNKLPEHIFHDGSFFQSVLTSMRVCTPTHKITDTNEGAPLHFGIPQTDLSHFLEHEVGSHVVLSVFSQAMCVRCCRRRSMHEENVIPLCDDANPRQSTASAYPNTCPIPWQSTASAESNLMTDTPTNNSHTVL